MRRELPSDPLLFLRDGAEVDPPEGVKARVAGRLAASIAAGVGAGAASALVAADAVARGAGPAQLSGSTTRVLAERFVRWSLVPLGVGVALGAGGQALRGGGDLHPRTAAPLVQAVASAAPSVVVAEPRTEPEPQVEAPAATAAPSSLVTKSTLTAERNVLDKARRQLAWDEPGKALAFLEEHARQFPRGQLSEEREVMLINVLALLGRSPEAKARGEAFLKRFPNSLMGQNVRAALIKADQGAADAK